MLAVDLPTVTQRRPASCFLEVNLWLVLCKLPLLVCRNVRELKGEDCITYTLTPSNSERTRRNQAFYVSHNLPQVPSCLPFPCCFGMRRQQESGRTTSCTDSAPDGAAEYNRSPQGPQALTFSAFTSSIKHCIACSALIGRLLLRFALHGLFASQSQYGVMRRAMPARIRRRSPQHGMRC